MMKKHKLMACMTICALISIVTFCLIELGLIHYSLYGFGVDHDQTLYLITDRSISTVDDGVFLKPLYWSQRYCSRPHRVAMDDQDRILIADSHTTYIFSREGVQLEEIPDPDSVQYDQMAAPASVFVNGATYFMKNTWYASAIYKEVDGQTTLFYKTPIQSYICLFLALSSGLLLLLFGLQLAATTPNKHLPYGPGGWLAAQKVPRK